VKNYLPRKISRKSTNQLLSYGQKTIFNMAAVRHLEFLKIWSRDSFSSTSARLQNLINIGWFFAEI